MGSLTPNRYEKIQPILEKYRQQLVSSGSFLTHELEAELKSTLKMGYKELEGIAIALTKDLDYQFVAVYYMEHIMGEHMSSAFKTHLGKVYGLKTYYVGDVELKAARAKILGGVSEKIGLILPWPP